MPLATVAIAPGRALRVLGACVAVFVALHLLGTFSDVVLGRDSVFGIVPRFNLNNEFTVPTWFTSGVLLLGGLLAVAVAATLRGQGRPGAKRWLLLAAVLAFLSFDETMMVHEALSAWSREARETAPVRVTAVAGLLGAIGLVVAVAGASLLRGLPPRIRWLAVASAAVYVLGAVGMDTVSGAVHARTGDSVAVYLLILLEEIGELVGVVLAVYTLLAYLAWLQRSDARAPAASAAAAPLAVPARGRG